MDKPEVYSQINDLQRKDTEETLKQCSKFIKWGANGQDTVLEIGCGSGNVTFEVLLPSLVQPFSKLIATDISEKMLEFTKSRYSHPKVMFRQLDIGTDKLPEDMIGSFDHIYSFYCFHWITNQRKLFSNIYKLLKPGGDILFITLGYTNVMDLLTELAEHPRWKRYSFEIEKNIPTYIHDVNFEKTLRHFMETTGFDIKFCKTTDKVRTFSFKEMMNFIESINICSNHIPLSFKDDYYNHIAKLLVKYKIRESEDSSQCNKSYSYISVVAKKPLK